MSLDSHVRDLRFATAIFCNLTFSVVMLPCVRFVTAICDRDLRLQLFASLPQKIACRCDFYGPLTTMAGM